jgi:HlyD family secretion protein
VLVALSGLTWGAYAIWFALAHVRASYARVTGLQVDVAAKDDTRVDSVLVRTGDQVSAGQVVVALDKATVEAQLEQAEAYLDAQKSALARAERELELTIRETAASVEEAEANLAAARARLAQCEAELQMQIQQQPDEVRRAQADLTAAESRLKDAGLNLRRMEKLQGQGAVSDQDLEAARTAHQTAEAAVESARAALAVAEARDHEGQICRQAVATRAAEEQQAQAGLKSARTQERRVALREEEVVERQAAVAEAAAAVQAARVHVSDCALRSPVNGVVVKGAGRSVKNGEVVVKGEPIVTLVSTDEDLWISAAVSELDISRVQEGQSVRIRIDAFGRQWFGGTVDKVGRATEVVGVQNSPWMLQQVPVKVTFDADRADVRHGMTCRAWIDIRE